MLDAKHKRWSVEASNTAKQTFNPIRAIVDTMKISPNPDKKMIALSIGDPTKFGNLQLPEEVTGAVIDAIRSEKCNGYAPSTGYKEAREAVAKYHFTDESPLTFEDVILACGCSGALEMAIDVLLNPGDNILLSKPGFSIYQTISISREHEVRHYNLLPERGWEVDLDHLESLIDDKTKAIIVTNPSNPCGSVYSKEHLQAIIQVAEKHMIPIISDEVYEELVFPGHTFYPLATLSQNVPILTCGAISKSFTVPGWRLGWILIHDRHGAFEEVRPGLVALSQQILGPCTLIQGALPTILTKTPKSFFDKTINVVQTNAQICFEELSKIPELKPVMPSGSMYMMVGIDMTNLKDIDNDVDFTEKLVAEQSVFCLPGKCFCYRDFFRVVLTLPEEMTRTACARIKQFCADHKQQEAQQKICLNDVGY